MTVLVVDKQNYKAFLYGAGVGKMDKTGYLWKWKLLWCKSSGLCHTAAWHPGPKLGWGVCLGCSHVWYPGRRCFPYSAFKIRMLCVHVQYFLERKNLCPHLSSRAGLSFPFFQTYRPIGVPSVWSRAVKSHLLCQVGYASADYEEETPGATSSIHACSREGVQVNSQGVCGGWGMLAISSLHSPTPGLASQCPIKVPWDI